MYENNEQVTLTKLLKVVREDQLFFGQRTKLTEVLKQMGFHHKKVNNMRYYYEQPKMSRSMLTCVG